MADIEVLNRVRIPGESDSSLPAIPAGTLDGAADTLFDWLGSFWSQVYSDPDFIKDLQQSRALEASQLYLDLLEGLKLEDRTNAPVFHRERWHPIAIRLSQRNKGSPEMFRLTSATTVNDDGTEVPQMNLGHQLSDAYASCTEIVLGGTDANFKGMTVYPLEGEAKGAKSIAVLCSSITGTGSIMVPGRDFMLLDGAIAIAEEQDPFTGGHSADFPKFDIDGESGEPDQETVLWACDTLFDKDYIRRYLGYALGLPAKSSEVYKRAVNAAWNAVASGATPLLVKALMAAICGIPTVKEDGEVVEKVEISSFGTNVVTDCNVYHFPVGSVMRRGIFPGAVLDRFDTMDKAIRVYASPASLPRLAAYNDFLDDEEEFKEDVPAMDIPPALFRSAVDRSFSVEWGLQDVRYVGDDANGNPRIRFRLGGSQSDEDIFWRDTWSAYEKAGVSMETCLAGIEHGTLPPKGGIWCQISPMEFFMKNLLGVNTLIITVRTDTLAADAPLYDPKFFGMLRDVVPEYIRLYVVEHMAPEEESYALGIKTSDDTDMFAALDAEDQVEYEGVRHAPGRRHGKNGKSGKMRERVASKWVARFRDGDGYDDE